MRYLILFVVLLSNMLFAEINGDQVWIIDPHKNLKSDGGDYLRVVTDLIDDKFKKPLELNVNANVVTVEGSSQQLYRSNQANNNTIPATVKSIPPIELAYREYQTSTLDVSTGVVTGDFTANPVAPTVTAGDWVWLGFELGTDGEIKIVSGATATVKVNAGYPVWTGLTPVGMIQVQADTACGGTGDAGWNFLSPLETDTIFFTGAGGGSGGGINDFKCLLGSSTAALSVKKGKMEINGINYYRSTDFPELTIGSELTDGAANYVYFDVEEEDLNVFLTQPENMNAGYLRRYAPLCYAVASGGALGEIFDYGVRKFYSVLQGDEDVCFPIDSQSSSDITTNNPYAHGLNLSPEKIFCKNGTIYNTSTTAYTDVACENFIDNKNYTHVNLLSGTVGTNEELSMQVCYRTEVIGITSETWDTCKTGQCWIDNTSNSFASDATFTFTNPFTDYPWCFIQVDENGTISYKGASGIKEVTTTSVTIDSEWTSLLNTSNDSYYVLCKKGGEVGGIDTNPEFGNVTVGGDLSVTGSILGSVPASDNANNADYLDSLDSTQFLRSDQNATLTGDLSVTGSINGEITNANNADYLDSLDSTQFLRSDQAITVSGSLFVEGETQLNGNLDMMDFHINNVNTTSINFADGSKVTSGTFDSSGNIIADIQGNANNAEYLDELDSTQFLRADQDATLSGDLQVTDLNITGTCTGCIPTSSEYNATSGLPTINFNNGAAQRFTLSGNVTLTLSNAVAGSAYVLRVTQATGTHYNITWPGSVQWGAAGVPTITASDGAIDLINLYYDGTNFYGSYAQDF